MKLVLFFLTALLKQALRDPGDIVLWGILADNDNETGNIPSCICSKMSVKQMDKAM